MVRAIVTADFHHGALAADVFAREINEWFLPSLHECFAQRVDYMVIAGDYFNHKMDMTSAASRLAFDCFSRILELCIRYQCPLYILQGTWSHDYDQVNLLANISSHLHLDNGRRLVTYISNTSTRVVEVLEGYRVLMIPEMYPVDVEAYRTACLQTPVQAVHFHGRWDFCAFKEEVIKSERGMGGAPVHRTSDFVDVVCGPITGGHIHTGDSNGKVFYTRSLSRWVFGEPEPKGYIVTQHVPNTGEFQVQYIDNVLATPYTTISIDAGREIEAYAEIRQLRAAGHRVKIRVDNAQTAQVLRQAAINDASIKIEIKNVVNDKVDNDLQSVFAQLYTDDHVETIRRFEQHINSSSAPLDSAFIHRHIQKPR
jgi:DNA repair exonuclease SbcCD nuclease subunit